MLLNNLLQVFRLYYAGLTPDDIAVLKEHQGGDALNLVGGGDLWVFVDVDLDDPGAVANF
jgi:hypothetical protein